MRLSVSHKKHTNSYTGPTPLSVHFPAHNKTYNTGSRTGISNKLNPFKCNLINYHTLYDYTFNTLKNGITPAPVLRIVWSKHEITFCGLVVGMPLGKRNAICSFVGLVDIKETGNGNAGFVQKLCVDNLNNIIKMVLYFCLRHCSFI